ESIEVNFNEERHGIFRVLPYRYRSEGKNIYTEITDIEVYREDQNERYDISRDDSNITIRIGNPNETITGIHDYEIRYKVNGVLRNIGNEDEFYWNATGNNWDTTIRRVVANFYLPTNIEIIDAACYVGEIGSTEPCQIQPTNNSVTFIAENLLPTEGLTGAISWESGLIPINTPQDPRDFLKLLMIIMPLGILVISSVFWYKRWQTTGKDPILPESITTQFSVPEGISPLQAGIILDNKADTVDVSAMIVELARRGYLIIEEIEGKFLNLGHDYKLIRTDKSDSDLSVAETLLLKGLFTSVPDFKKILKVIK